ncbi:hypothetical protein S40288_09589 [Stachybotrys chartarum IBT 40288]|nr:hypothetical protein S40288_09589 [Stachybotrys chartarum IBT 40288]
MTPTSQDERAGSRRFHGASQVRGYGPSSLDPSENPILIEVDRLMAEYTKNVKPNLTPKSTKGKAYYVVDKLRQEVTKDVQLQALRGHSRFSTASSDILRPPATTLTLTHEVTLDCERPTKLPSHLHTCPTRNTTAVHSPTDDGSDWPEAAPAHSQGTTPFHIAGEPPLCPEQRNTMDLAMQGLNMFITGSGGCGKSVLVKFLYASLMARYQNTSKTVHLLAPTGQASINIGGRTTYNYAGWTPEDAKKPLDGPGSIIAKARGQHIFGRYRNTRVIMIDEISMVESQFFERLSRVMSAIREDPRPFGGVQIIVVGDFCQLPPVKPFQHCIWCGKGMNAVNGRWSCPDGHGPEFESQDKWAFKAPEWERCGFVYVHLNQIHRQSDKAFIKVLQKCRLGQHLDDADTYLLLSHDTEVINGTELKSTRAEVEKRNFEEFAKIPGHFHQYKAADACNRAKGETREPFERLEGHRYLQDLQLKVDTPVILLANVELDCGLCNGRQGVVVGFMQSHTIEQPRPPQRTKYQYDEDGFHAAVEKYDQIVAYLRRARHHNVMFPEVRFANGEQRVIGPDCAVVGYGNQSPYSYLSRTQIPLAQGWAITIHKSQSLSLDHVIVDLSQIFEHGQAYVALSRARSLRGLKLEGANASRLRSIFRLDNAVREFMRSLDPNNVG